MDDMVLIKGKMVELTDEEKKNTENFHRNRIAFVWLNGELLVNNPHDDRDHQHWLLEDYGVPIEQFEKLPRGYMIKDRIQLFISSNHSQISKTDLRLPMSYIIELREIYREHFPENEGRVWVYNGVTVGKPGEIWPPIECLGELYVD